MSDNEVSTNKVKEIPFSLIKGLINSNQYA